MTDISYNVAKKIDPLGRKGAAKFVDDISASQLRQIYGNVKQAEHRYRADGDVEATIRRLQLLKPKLAYLAARDPDTEEFKQWATGQIDKVVSEPSKPRLEYFFRLMEAIVAYHNCNENRGSMQFEVDENPINNVDSTAEKRAEQYYNDGVTTTQLRHVYGEVKRAQASYRQHRETGESDSEEHVDEAKKTLQLLLPNLTYMAGRHEATDRLVTDVRGWIKYAVNGSGTELEQFFDLMEAIVAYHKYYAETEGDTQ